MMVLFRKLFSTKQPPTMILKQYKLLTNVFFSFEQTKKLFENSINEKLQICITYHTIVYIQ